jgi:hypothetical protein
MTTENQLPRIVVSRVQDLGREMEKYAGAGPSGPGAANTALPRYVASVNGTPVPAAAVYRSTVNGSVPSGEREAEAFCASGSVIFVSV